MNETGIWELEKHSLLVFRTTPSKSTWRVNFRKYTWSPVQQRLSSRIITVGRFTTASILWLSWFPGSTGMGNLEPQTRPQPLPGSRPKYLYAFQGAAPWSRPQGRCGSEEPWRLKATGSAHKRTSPPATRWGERARKRPLVWWRDRVQGLAIVGNCQGRVRSSGCSAHGGERGKKQVALAGLTPFLKEKELHLTPSANFWTVYLGGHGDKISAHERKPRPGRRRT